MTKYPYSTGYVKNSQTSRESAEALDRSGSADSQASFILSRLEDMGIMGATADEMTVFMQTHGFPKIHNGTVAGRLVHLEKQALILKTAETRKTRANRRANVYVLERHRDAVEALMPESGEYEGGGGVARSGRSPSPKQAALEELARMTLKIAEGKDDYGYATASYDPLTTSRILNMARTAGLL